MSEHSYTRMWTHMIFHTKNLQPLIAASVAPQIYEHVKAQFTECGCPVHIINGTKDHVHVLTLANPMMSVTDIAKQVKGHTAYWINYNKLTRHRFNWEKGFASFSVSDKDVLSVFNQIRRQKRLHKSVSFVEEMDGLVSANGLYPRKLIAGQPAEGPEKNFSEANT